VEGFAQLRKDHLLSEMKAKKEPAKEVSRTDDLIFWVEKYPGAMDDC
jgi:hypothetical protein